MTPGQTENWIKYYNENQDYKGNVSTSMSASKFLEAISYARLEGIEDLTQDILRDIQKFEATFKRYINCDKEARIKSEVVNQIKNFFYGVKAK